MENYYAVQWQNPKTLVWETCNTFDPNDFSIPSLFISEVEANIELQEWLENGSNCRVIEVTLKEIV